MAIAAVRSAGPSAKRLGRAEGALADVALSLPGELSEELTGSMRISTPEAALRLVFRRGRPVEIEHDAGKPVDARLHAEYETWVDMIQGRYNGLEAVTRGLLVARGNLHKAMALGAEHVPVAPYRWHFEVGRPKVGKYRMARVVTTRGHGFLESHPIPGSTGAGPAVKTSGNGNGRNGAGAPGGPAPATVHLASVAEKAARPVIVLHGLGATKTSMLPTVAGLAPGRTVHALDQLGHGDSDKPYLNYTPRVLADAVIRYLDLIEAEKVDMIGNSLGGRVSLEVASHWPDRVGRLVLYAPAMAPTRDRRLTQLLRLVPSELGIIPGIFNRNRAELVLRSLLGGLGPDQQHLVDGAIDDFLRIYSSPSARRALYSSGLSYLLAEPFGENGFWTHLPKVEAPALFIWGRHDTLVSWRYSRATAKSMPHSVSVIYEDGGHVPQIEHPERTLVMTENFLNGIQPVSGPTVTIWRA